MNPVPLYYVWQYTDVDRRFWQEHLEDWAPRRIYDAHTHVNEPRFRVEAMSEQKRRQYWVNEVGEPIGEEDADRCHRIVFPGREFSCLVFGFPTLEFDIEASNAALAESCRRRGWHRLAVVRPQWPAEQVARELDQPGVLGVKVYYALISQDPDSRDKHLEASIFEYVPHHQLALLDRRGAWLTLHVPKAGRLGHLENIAEVRQIREQYPSIVLVLAHLGRSYTLPHAEEALPPLADDPGIYFDISAVMNPDVLAYAIATLGPERILYGSDNPVLYMRGRQQWNDRTYRNRTSYPFYFNQQREPPEVEAGYTLYLYEALLALKQACGRQRLDRAQIEAIFHGNAQRLIAQVTARKA
jgi:uncharacterized protein